MANYNSLEEMLNTTENMQHLVVSTGHDDDTMTFDGVDWFMFNGIKASSLYVSGNSWIGLGANADSFLYAEEMPRCGISIGRRQPSLMRIGF